MEFKDELLLTGRNIVCCFIDSYPEYVLLDRAKHFVDKVDEILHLSTVLYSENVKEDISLET